MLMALPALPYPVRLALGLCPAHPMARRVRLPNSGWHLQLLVGRRLVRGRASECLGGSGGGSGGPRRTGPGRRTVSARGLTGCDLLVRLLRAVTAAAKIAAVKARGLYGPRGAMGAMPRAILVDAAFGAVGAAGAITGAPSPIAARAVASWRTASTATSPSKTAAQGIAIKKRAGEREVGVLGASVEVGRPPDGLRAMGGGGTEVTAPKAAGPLTPSVVKMAPMTDAREVGNEPVVPPQTGGARPYPRKEA